MLVTQLSSSFCQTSYPSSYPPRSRRYLFQAYLTISSLLTSPIARRFRSRDNWYRHNTIPLCCHPREQVSHARRASSHSLWYGPWYAMALGPGSEDAPKWDAFRCVWRKWRFVSYEWVFQVGQVIRGIGFDSCWIVLGEALLSMRRPKARIMLLQSGIQF